MSPGRTKETLERAKGFEPSTPTLARSCSTTELHPHPSVWRRSLAGNGQSYAKCGSRMQLPARDPNRQLAFIGDNGLDFARNGVRTVATLFYSVFKRETLPTGVLRAPQPSPGRLQIGLSNAN